MRRLRARPLAAVRCSSLKDGRLPRAAAIRCPRPQRIGTADDIQQIPATAAVLPFACIGIEQIAPEQGSGSPSSSKRIVL